MAHEWASTKRDGALRRVRTGFIATTLIALGCTIAAPLSSAQSKTPSKKSAASTFSLPTLIDEAKAEAAGGGKLVVWDSSASVTQIAQNFSAKYGIPVTATKVSAASQYTQLEALKGNPNPSVDVVLFADGPELTAQLMPQGIVKSWVPPDLKVPKNLQKPLVYLNQPSVFYYDPALYSSCPINNVWQLTTAKWKGRFAVDDPTQTPEILQWFAEMAINGKAQLAAAYKAEFHHKYTGSNAAYTFIKDLAQNAPLVVSSLDNAIEDAGGPGVTTSTAAIALAHGSTYPDAATLGYHVAMCKNIDPWDGYIYPKFAVETTATHHTYEAELFVHYIETRAGNYPAASGGGEAGSSLVKGMIGGPPGLLNTEQHNNTFLRLRIPSMSHDFAIQGGLQLLWTENLATP
jgi:iron(III) transport system substrate-binding protein